MSELIVVSSELFFTSGCSSSSSSPCHLTVAAIPETKKENIVSNYETWIKFHTKTKRVISFFGLITRVVLRNQVERSIVSNDKASFIGHYLYCKSQQPLLLVHKGRCEVENQITHHIFPKKISPTVCQNSSKKFNSAQNIKKVNMFQQAEQISKTKNNILPTNTWLSA